MILEGSSRVRALICVKPLSLSSHICVTKHTTNAPSYRTRRLGRSREHGVDEVGNDRASFPPWRFNLSNLLEHYPAGARRFAALRGRLLLPLVPTPRAPAFLSVRALKKPTPRHRRTFRTRQPRQLHTARPRHHGGEMVRADPFMHVRFVRTANSRFESFFSLPHHACRLYARRASRHQPPCLHRHGRTTLSLISRPPSPLESAQPASHPNAQMHKSATSPNMPCGHTAVGR